VNAAHRHRIGNLPAEPTSFVGRRGEVADLARRLAGFRLVTVTGPGGVGKTRLALRVASQRHPGPRNGVWFVDLTVVSDPLRLTRASPDPQSVAQLIAVTLGVREESTRPPLQMLTDYLARRRVLLLLDSCEAALPACAAVADTLLRACPGLRILAASREPLGVYGEIRVGVEPLLVPDPQRLPATLDALADCESVTLFLARAHTVVPDSGLTDTDRQAVAGICRRIDGLPLGIELAAAPLRALTPQQILDQLADRLAALGPPHPGIPDRHRTLRACIDWSFDLCTEAEQRLWARLSVFAGGFELDAAEGICADQAIPTADVLPLVSDLVDKSILVGEDQGGRVRFRMLDAIRDYGREKLHETGDEAGLRRCHRDWYHQLAARARQDLISSRQHYWLDRLAQEHPNLNTAMEYNLTEPGQTEQALLLAVTLPTLHWWTRGLFSEGWRWLDAALAQTTTATTLRARALLLAGYLAIAQGDLDTGTRQLRQGEQLTSTLDDPTNHAFALYLHGTAAGLRNDLPAAVAHLERALTVLPDPPAQELELRLAVLLTLGAHAGLTGDRQRAHTCYQEILAITEPRQGTYYRSQALWALGIEAWRHNEYDEATKQVSASLRIKQNNLSVDRHGIVLCVETLAWIAASQQQHQRAGILLGAADTLWTDLGTTITTHSHLIGYHHTCEQLTRAALGDPAYTTAFRHGSNLSYNDTITHTLEHHSPAPHPKA